MAGHGSPQSEFRHRWSCADTPRSRNGAVNNAFRLLIWICALLALTGNSRAAAQQPDPRFRLAWGGGTAQNWQGEIKIENGSMANPKALALTVDAPSTVLQKGNQLEIRHQIATRYGGVDVDLKQATANTRITVNLSTPQGEESFSQTWTLAELSADINQPLDSQGNRFSAGRTPGDLIHVDIDRPHLVFDSEETFSFSLAPTLTQFKQQEVRCEIKLKNNPGTPTQSLAFTTDASGSAPLQQVQLRLPPDEGVYEIEMRLNRKGGAGFGDALFVANRNPVTRCIQLVVLAAQRPQERSEPWTQHQTWTAEQLANSKPASGPIWGLQRLALPRQNDGAFHHGQIQSVQNPTNDRSRAVQISSHGWIAVPIRKQAGPQRVTIDYVASPGSQFSVEFLAKENLHGGGYSSGVCIPETPVDFENSQSTQQQHQFHIWATEHDGWLLISNSHKTNSVLLNGIGIETGPRRIASTAQPAADNGIPLRKQFALYDAPDFPARFQAPRRFDSQLSQHLDDWNTFYQGIDRMIQQLHLDGFDGAFVAVASNGSSIYPEQRLGSGPRFDSGVFASLGCDPLQKDVVELMMRMFAREGLDLVPVINFNSPLPQLESQRSDRSVHSFDLTDNYGNQSTLSNRLLPIYNSLDRQLQGNCNEIVQSFSTRYSQHASYGGIGITCRPDCHTMLAGSGHGWDQATLNRFAAAAGIRDPSVESITQQSLPQWLAWRSSRMLDWYTEMARRTDGQFYLLPVNIYRNAELASLLTPSLHRSAEFTSAMQVVGLDFVDQEPLNKRELARRNIVVAASGQIDPADSLANRRVELNVRQTPGANQFFERTSAATLLALRAKWNTIENIEALPGLENASPIRKQVFSVAGPESERHLISAIRQNDSQICMQGGMGPTSAIAEFGRLPAVSFDTVDEEPGSPICVRQYADGGKHWFYVLNESPWTMEVTLNVGSADSRGRMLQASSSGVVIPPQTLQGKPIAMQKSVSGTTLKFNIEPWSLYAGRSQSPTSRNTWHINSFDAKPLAESSGAIRKKLYQLQSKLAKTKAASPLSDLQNGSFESFSDPKESGWEFGGHDEKSFQLDDDAADGETCVTMRSNGQQIWIRSNSLVAPETGRASVAVWLKLNDPSKQPPLRIFLECQSDNQNFLRSGSLGGLEPGQSSPLSGQWERFAVHFDDLPVDMQQFRIGFEMSQAGEVTIDNVQVFDRWFDENDSVAMTQLLASAGSRLQSPASINNARRVLESYWVRFLDEHIGAEPEKQPTTTARLPFPFGESNKNSSGPTTAPFIEPNADAAQRKPRRPFFFGRKPRSR